MLTLDKIYLCGSLMSSWRELYKYNSGNKVGKGHSLPLETKQEICPCLSPRRTNSCFHCKCHVIFLAAPQESFKGPFPVVLVC